MSFAVEGGAPSRAWRSRLIWSVLFLALAHGALYASFTPPWGLIDEEQHLDYVAALAERASIPVVGQTYLSPTIADSVLAVERWQHYGFLPRSSADVHQWGLEGHSYEGYQSPLYYTLLAPVYAALPGDILTKLYALRWASLLISLVTLVIVYRIVRELAPGAPVLAALACLLLALVPERLASVTQVNNDVLLELFAAAVVLVSTRVILHGLTWQRSLLLGCLLGLAALSKASAALLLVLVPFVWWANRETPGWPRYLAAMAVPAALLAAPVLARNLSLYGDLSGMAGFHRLAQYAARPLTGSSVLGAAIDAFRYQWVIWWKGGTVGSNPVINAIYVVLAGLALLSLAGILKWWRADEPETGQAGTGRRRAVLVMFGALIAVTGAAALGSYFSGLEPVVQGRLFSGAGAPLVILFVAGLWQSSRRRWLFGALVVLLVALSALFLFGDLLPYFYYWSPFTLHGIPSPATVSGLAGKWAAVSARLLADKPAFVKAALPWLLVAGAASLALAAGAFWAVTRHPEQETTAERFGLSVRRNARAALHDPLLWVAVLLLAVYAAAATIPPAGTFWSLDDGGKFIYLQNVIRTGDPAAPLVYPGQALDSGLRFVPLLWWVLANGQIYSWWPIGFPLMTLPFYLALGWAGIYVLPVLSGVLTATLAGVLFRQVQPGSRWGAAVAALVTGLATPVAFYSSQFWEHTPAVACFMAALCCLLEGYKNDRLRWWLLAGVLGAVGAFLRTEIAGMMAGLLAALLFLRPRRAVLAGVAFGVACLPWLAFNQHFMGHFLSRQWLPGSASLSTTLFMWTRQGGLWFIPQTLFNAPFIAALPLPPAVLIAGTVLLGLALVLPAARRWWPLLAAAYAGLLAISLYVLANPAGYRSVHGLVLIAPHVAFAGWLYAQRSNWRRSLLPALLAGTVVLFGAAYIGRGWMAAGGQQWGPRYLLAFYPLLVVASLAGLITAWPRLVQPARITLLGLYIAATLAGAGFEVRGSQAVAATTGGYGQTRQALQTLGTAPIATPCTWLPMVIPEFYWQGNVYSVTSADARAAWLPAARATGADTGYSVELDLCTLRLLDEVAAMRQANPSGITVEPLVLK